MKISKNIVLDCNDCSERGYILLALLLVVAIMTIALAIMVPRIAFEIRRDKEEELVHRGVQYTRAIRNFSKRTGHYPSTLAELQDPNGIKYLRKFYKDPMTGKDFKLLHQADIPSLGGSTNLAATGRDPNASTNVQTAAGGLDSASNNGQAPDGQTASANPNQDSPNQNSPGQGITGVGSSMAGPSSRSAIGSTDNGSQPGQSIFGVASTSKAASIREFDKKSHYNDWLFYYSPQYDQGFEIKGPTSSSLTNVAGMAGQRLGQQQAAGLAGQQQQQIAPPAEPESPQPVPGGIQ
jgi:type II secretory pathway pseudopilin PulG